MIATLSENNSEWLKIAFHICKDSYLANDLVQDMYLRIYKYPPKKEINNFYVYVVIKNCFYDHLKNENQYTQLNERTLEQAEDVTNQAYFSLLDRLDDELDKIHWYKKRLILNRQEESPRVIQKKTGINYMHIYRSCNKTEDDLREQLKKSYTEYQNGTL